MFAGEQRWVRTSQDHRLRVRVVQGVCLWHCFAVLDGLLEEGSDFALRQVTSNARDYADDMLFRLFPTFGLPVQLPQTVRAAGNGVYDKAAE
jgi:hypothetical protein